MASDSSEPLEAQVAQHQRKNKELNEQIKLLVKTEKRLYRAQRDVQEQLSRMESVNRFALEASRTTSLREVSELALAAFSSTLRVDQSVALLPADDGTWRVVAVNAFETPMRVPAGTRVEIPESLPHELVFAPVEGGQRPAMLREFDALFEDEDDDLLMEVVVPLRRTGERAVGAIVLRTLAGVSSRMAPPGEADRIFIELLASHAGSAIENVLHWEERAHNIALEKELEVARAVQHALLPDMVGAVPGFSLAGHYEPAAVCGGDWWMWKRPDDKHVLVLIGDVTGHGVPAALITGVAVGCVDALRPGVSVSEALHQLDTAVLKAAKGEFCMSCFATLIDTETGETTVANAGHTFPYVGRWDGSRWVLSSLLARGRLLGSIDDYEFRTASSALGPGDVVVWFTDGITECTNGERQWRERGLRNAFAAALEKHGSPFEAPVQPAEIRDQVMTRLREFSRGVAADDDMTLVVGVRAPE